MCLMDCCGSPHSIKLQKRETKTEQSDLKAAFIPKHQDSYNCCLWVTIMWISTVGVMHIWKPALSRQPSQHLLRLQMSLDFCWPNQEKHLFMSYMSFESNFHYFWIQLHSLQLKGNRPTQFAKAILVFKRYKFLPYLTCYLHTELLHMVLFHCWTW